MNNQIYDLARKCKESSDKTVRIVLRQQGQKTVPCGVSISGGQFRESVQSLASLISFKYPLIADDLMRHLKQYKDNVLLHQGAIDAIIDCLISVEGRSAQAPKKIFISHKSEDAAFATELSKLLRLYVGSELNCIFCSSIPGYEIDLCKRVFPEIKKQFNEYELLTIFIHSPRYYLSPVCMNEMGAAWILETEHYSFLTADCDFNSLKGVINDKEIAIKVNSPDAKSRMNAFLQKVLLFMNLRELDFSDHHMLSRWEDDRDSFLSAVCKL